VNRKSDIDDHVSTLFKIEIEIGGGLTEREKILLFNSARKCEVNKLLNGDFNFSYELNEG